MLDFSKYDMLGSEIRPGDICVVYTKQGIKPIIYIGGTKGNASTGKFGRFYTPEGKSSIRYSSVIFAFDPLGERRNNSETISKLLRKYYEGVK